MIRTLPLLCSRCGKEFIPQHGLYYQDDFSVQNFKDIKLVCDQCIAEWKNKWQITDAEYKEHNYVLTVTITLKDGTVYKDMDCTPIEETESVITGEDIPPEAQHKLYEYYIAFAKEQEAHQIKDCFFEKTDEGKFVADITTNGGEKFEKLAFALEEGYLKLEQDVPQYVMDGLINAFKSYLAQEQMLSTSTQPAPRPPQRKTMPESQWPLGGGYGRNNKNPFGGF
ncbi:MAG: hypothetical protein SPL86_12375 [Succiniclasticum sp.]|uniref:hypothetical protein n=1 Tax=Succiniclasticum sp. TaxID=2775030 RepID=UPI002A9130FB|nr:hypothetical protein [Succiniclasticum sp.]MDY6292262.1 hypothetical protein [Succiniclasticum sp.]